jgi:hypothetical protein
MHRTGLGGGAGRGEAASAPTGPSGPLLAPLLRLPGMAPAAGRAPNFVRRSRTACTVRDACGVRKFTRGAWGQRPIARYALICGSYGGQSRKCIWTLRHPHLIQPYLAYYDYLASHYGGPWCSPIPWWCD